LLQCGIFGVIAPGRRDNRVSPAYKAREITLM
jgi:hypothetical protein